MSMSTLAFQGYLEKTGLSREEAIFATNNSRTPFLTYLEQVAKNMQVIGKKEAKAEAAKLILMTNIVSEDDSKNFILMKAFISVTSYQFGKEADFEAQLTSFSGDFMIEEFCNPILQDSDKILELREQFIASKTLGSRKGVWSKFFG